MPAAYFRQVGEKERVRHLTAMAALHDIKSADGIALKPPNLTLNSEDGNEIAVLRPGSK